MVTIYVRHILMKKKSQLCVCVCACVCVVMHACVCVFEFVSVCDVLDKINTSKGLWPSDVRLPYINKLGESGRNILPPYYTT